MSKDLSLLRPFDLEKAKQGELTVSGCKYISGPDTLGNIVFESKDGKYILAHPKYFVMAPLCWIEDKPLYKGDTLYCIKTDMDSPVVVIKEIRKNTICDNAIYFQNHDFKWTTQDNLTWTKPKQKNRGWINVYKDGESFWYDSQSLANDSAMEDRIACVSFKYEVD